MFEEMLNGSWDLTILDADPPSAHLGSLAAGDYDGDGRVEVFIGGWHDRHPCILCYRPATLERRRVADRCCGVGLVLEDVDGDGTLELVTTLEPPVSGRVPARDAQARTGRDELCWLKAGADPAALWTPHVIDADVTGSAHDIVFADVDGDGERELVANSISGRVPGLYVYKKGADPSSPWQKSVIQEGFFEEGLAAGDVDGDGRLEVLSGTHWYRAPVSGPFGGPWEQHALAPGFREMVRVALVDVTGNGLPDAVVCESEYLDGRMSWFENRFGDGPEDPWLEHPVDRGLYYAHSIWTEPSGGRPCPDGAARVVVAEMAEGGWSAPRNRDARVIEYSTRDGGKSWAVDVLGRGSGTHQATVMDVDGDGEAEVVGKQWWRPKVQVWKRRRPEAKLPGLRHRFIDRDKPFTSTDIVTVDVDGDGLTDVVCGKWWYKNPGWRRHEIPGVYQVHAAFDLDGDGRQELIATRESADAAGGDWYRGLTSDFVWLKPVDPAAGGWEEHPIGSGSGDWPHGTLVAPLLPGGGLALVAAYHGGGKHPELFEIPADPREPDWPSRVIAEIDCHEELVAHDMTGNGLLDVVLGQFLLENLGDGTFRPHEIAPGFDAARVAVTDVNGDGLPDVVAGEEVLDFENKVTPLSRLVWLENPGTADGAWKMHVIDKVRCAHSVGVADIDGDGHVEILCGEHDPFYPYRTRCRLMVYRKADPTGRAWTRHVVDDRFEHHDGVKVFEVGPGRVGVVSHGWKDSRYVHLWETP